MIWIIDTNIIVHWLMAKQVMSCCVEQFRLSSEFSTIYENRLKHSIAFISRALEIPKERHDFLVVELSLNEIFSGVRDEVRSILLFSKGVPLSRLTSMRSAKEARFSEELAKIVYEATSRGLDTLFGTAGMDIIHTTSPSDEKTYLEVYSSLVFLHPSLATQDAILVATAIFQKADYFVTEDNTLIGLGKDKRFGARYTIKIVAPQQASQLLGE